MPFCECMCVHCAGMPVAFCFAWVSDQGSAPLSHETRLSCWNLGPIPGACLMNCGLYSQVPESSEQVVPGLCFRFPGQDQDRILGGN